MPYDIKLDEQSSFLKVTLSGKETQEDNEYATDSVVKECERRGYDRILLDVRDLGAHDGFISDYEFVDYLDKGAFKRIIRRLAIIHGSPRNESAVFFEICCQNRGISIKAFSNVKDAIGWLTE